MFLSSKEITELFKKGFTLEAQEKILELRGSAIELQEENITLKGRIKELEEKLKINNNLKFDTAYYWLEEGNDKKGPFCQKCYDDQNKLSRLHENGTDYWHCYICKNNFKGSHYVRPSNNIRIQRA